MILLINSQNQHKKSFVICPAGRHTKHATILSLMQLNYTSTHSKILKFMHGNLTSGICLLTKTPKLPPGLPKTAPSRKI